MYQTTSVVANLLALLILIACLPVISAYPSIIPPYLLGWLVMNVAIWNANRGRSDGGRPNPRLRPGPPPQHWELSIGGKQVTAELVAQADLTSPKELLATGPYSVHRLNPNYYYEEVKFATHAGLYRVPREAVDPD